MDERSASVSEDELCEKCIIKQLLNSVFAWYHELSKPRVCVIHEVLIIHDIMLNLIQQLLVIVLIVAVLPWLVRSYLDRAVRARFSKAPETFRARKAIFSQFVTKDGEA